MVMLIVGVFLVGVSVALYARLKLAADEEEKDGK